MKTPTTRVFARRLALIEVPTQVEKSRMGYILAGVVTHLRMMVCSTFH